MSNKRFNPAKLDKLNNPKRLVALPVEYIIEKTEISSPKTIIDLGAGTGFYSGYFAKAFKDSKVYATDISEVMVDWMKENKVKEQPNIIPMLMADSKIDLKDEIADFLYMIYLHHELDKPIETLKEAFRLLKTGATIAISDWKKEEMEMGPNIAIRVDPNDIKVQLEKSGFVQVKIYEDLKQNYLVVAKK